MRAVDTNVLVRLVVRNDANEVRATEEFIASGAWVSQMEDLANYRGEWVEPARTEYHGYDVLELPPPSQAWATNEMLNRVTCGVAVREVRPSPCLRDRPTERRGLERRHHRAVHGRQGGQHGVVGEQQLQCVRVGYHRGWLRIRAT
jgi:hypothetical protein